MNNKIVVTVEGGVVTAVLSNVLAEVEVIDYDNPTEDGSDIPEFTNEKLNELY